MTATAAKLQKGGAFLMEDVAPDTIFSPEDFSDELKMISQTTKDFCDNEIVPNIEKLEKLEGTLNEDLLRKLGDIGLLGIEIPEEYGGTDLPKTAAMLVAEGMAVLGGFSTTYGAHQSIGSLPTVYFGNAAQKEKYLPKLNTAEIIAAYALTEPNAGSDALGGQCKAVLSDDGKYYTLDGTKMWITNAGFADLFTVFARVDGQKEKFSAFLVEKTMAGVSTGAEEKKMGIKSSSTRMLILDKVKVPVENLLGDVGQGAKIAFNILNTGRFKLGAGGLGGAKNALAIATKYSQERKQFGQPISNFGMMQEKLGEMAARIFACESVIYRTAGLIDEAIGDSKDGAFKLKCIEEYAVECSIIKVLGSEVLTYVVDEGVQIHGGYGFSAEYAIERAYRDARIMRLYEGTNEINRMLIPGMLLKRAMKGELPLMQAAQGVQKKVMDPSLEEQNDGGLLGEELRAVKNLKNLVLMLAGTAAMKFGAKVDTEQETMARIADIIIGLYASESSILRVRKLKERGVDTAIMEQMTKLYTHNAVEEAAVAGRQAVCRLTEDEQEIAVYMGALKRFTRHATVNTIGLRRSIAQSVLEVTGYPVAL
ncbi:MAG: acyl-CoA dehydrogenase [Candidatus Kapaibacterium sp.]|nr:MAG: acyl-CoA dehydrogenase [Candidatus Kapabacteria bacterium]